jgi:hypothetical protein
MRSSFDRRVWHRRVYDGQLKGTICDARGSCPSIWSTLKQVFWWFRLIRCAYKSLRCMPRYRDLAIFVLMIDRRLTDRQTDYFTPAVHARTRDYREYIPGSRGCSVLLSVSSACSSRNVTTSSCRNLVRWEMMREFIISSEDKGSSIMAALVRFIKT